jgi:Legume lectin domain
VDMTSSGVDLHSGHLFSVHVVYDGTNLTMTITDTTNTALKFTQAWPVNIPGTVGANTAFVGFTGGTGGLTANQSVLTWTYTVN